VPAHKKVGTSIPFIFNFKSINPMTQSNPTQSQQVFNLLILDESGSMESIRASIINSFNEVIQTIQAAEAKSRTEERLQEHFVSLYIFNGESIREVHLNVPVQQVAALTMETYRPNAGTPLFDTMGMALTRHEKAIEGKEAAVTLVTILTDGEENMSKEYDGQAIVALVSRLRSIGWVFNYIGTDHDVEAFSAKISIRASMRYKKNSEGLIDMLTTEKTSRSRFYENIKDPNYSPSQANEDYYKEDEKKAGDKRQSHENN
jgi:hypothetical protein